MEMWQRRCLLHVCTLLLLTSVCRCESLRPDPFAKLFEEINNDIYDDDGQNGPIPCAELNKGLDLPCLCSVSADNGTDINCDYIAFAGDFPVLPFRHPVHSFSQRSAGYQSLSAQLFTASDIPLKRLDVSGNSVIRVTDRLLEGLHDTLEHLNFSSNLLGDQLNPVFSSSEFQNLKSLKTLDLSDNDLKALDDSLLKGCERLQELHLSRNSLTRVPSGTLKSATSLTSLHLDRNRIGIINNDAFDTLANLQFLNVSRNVIANVDTKGFRGLSQLKAVDLSYNKISRLTESVFQDSAELEEIKLNYNYLPAIPVSAFRELASLKKLSLSANLIQSVDSNVGDIGSLEYLDLSRNSIVDLGNGTLSRLQQLKTLQLSVNSLRKVEDGAFRGLDNLEELFLDDNNMLAVPQPSLRHVPKLRRLSLSFNRIAVVSDQLFESNPLLEHLSLSHNVIREIPETTFRPLKSLTHLDLRGNQLTTVGNSILSHVASSLRRLDLGYNRLTDLEALNLPVLESLVLDHNNLTDLKRGQFSKLIKLKSLNLSYNNIDLIASGVFKGLDNLQQVDLRFNSLGTLAIGVFEGLTNLRAVYLQDNFLQKIDSKTFANLPQLRLLQLTRNQIDEIQPAAFDSVPRLTKLLLRSNKLETFPKDSVNSGGLVPVAQLDLSYNSIGALGADDLKNWTSLEMIMLNHNHLTLVNDAAFSPLRALKSINLSFNRLRLLGNYTFARLPKLRVIDLSQNKLETIGYGLFHNSTQLQFISMGYNRLRLLHDRLFEGVARLNLNLEHNRLAALPPTIFDRSKVHRLHTINLAHNFFEEVPVEALQKQYFFLDNMNFAGNRIRQIPSDANVLVTIKTLDLSFNPLSEDSIQNILSEPKTVKDLNMAGTGVTKVPVLETPFLRRLNLSSNKIEGLSESSFQRPTLLEVLDVSSNQIPNLSVNMNGVWSKLPHLKKLILSKNPISFIVRNDFSSLAALEVLHLEQLSSCTKIDAAAFANFRNLREFHLHGLPRLEALDARAVLRPMSSLENLQIELTEPSLQDQLAPVLLPRIRQVHVHGRGGLRAISPAVFAGLTSPSLRFVLRDTAVTSIPASLLFTVPMSTSLVLDVSGAKLAVLSPQFLSAADNHGQFLELRGLRDNPIICDCNARPFRRWLKAHIPQRGAKSRRTPRQTVPEESESILVQVAATNTLGRPKQNSTTPASDLVAFKFETSARNITIPRKPEEEPTTALTEGEVFVVDTGFEENISNPEEEPVWDFAKELTEVRCTGPSSLLGIKVIDLAEEELGCEGLGRGEVIEPDEKNDTSSADTMDVVVAARPSRPFTPAQSSAPVNTEEEPDIIWYNENEVSDSNNSPSAKDNRRDQKKNKADGARPESATGAAGLNNVDALIIGIVGGVVAFVAILIIIICLVRLKTSATPYRGGPLAGPLALRHDKCTCMGPGGHHGGQPMLCHCLPGYPGHAFHGPPAMQALPALPSLPPPHPPSRAPTRNSIYSAPLQAKMVPPSTPRSALGLASRASFYPPTPYYVTFPSESDTEHVHR